VTDRRSKPITVDGSWSISWRHDGGHLFSVQVVPAGVDVFGELVVSTTRLGGGTQPMYRGGKIVLQVFASDPWTVTIVDEPQQPEIGLPATLTGIGSTNSPPLSPDVPWLIEWELAGAGPFGVELFPLPTGEPWLLVAVEGPRVGCVPVTTRGLVYLHVATDVRWTLRLARTTGEVVCPAS
jgi:hypothetical protein